MSLLPSLYPQIITIAIVGVLTWIGTRIRNWLERKKTSLSYFIAETDFLHSDDRLEKCYSIRIFNDGDKRIKSITADIIISVGGKVKIASHKRLKSTQQIKPNHIEFTIEDLNCKEEINLVAITTGEIEQTSKPLINIRAEGVNALEKSNSQGSIWAGRIIAAEIGIFIGICIPIIVDIFSPVVPPDKPDRIENIFSILNKAQLSSMFPELVKEHDDISYVGTAFHLVHCYLKDTSNEEKYIKALKDIADIGDISASSKGVIYYLIYKIDARTKDKKEAEEYISKCKVETPVMYQHLIEQDQYYNLDSLQCWMMKNNY